MVRRPEPPDASVRARAAELARDVFLSAGAGTGKTSVLVARYMAALDSGLSPREIVAMTFTKKAAAEMRERLRAECRARMQTADGEEGRRWRNTVSELETAHIGTIHSFCGALLRMYALDAGVDPLFVALEGRPGALLLSRSVATAFTQRLKDSEPTAVRLASVWRRDGIISEICGIINSREQYQAFLTSPPSVEDIQAVWERELEQAVIGMAVADPMLTSAAEALVDLARPNPTARFAPEALTVIEELAALAGCNPAEAVNHLRAAEQAAAVRKQGKGAGWPDPEQFQAVKDTLNAVKDRLRAYLHLCDIDVRDDVHSEAAEIAASLWAEAGACLSAYTEAKRARAALDFADLQLLAERLLRDSERVRMGCRERYRQMLVDEFQDTNALQDAIIRQTTGFDAQSPDRPGPRVFVVGDAKQSIYGFRNADVTVFQRVRDEFSNGAPGVDAHSLEAAFRSTRTLVGFHNWLFSNDAVMGLLDGPGCERRRVFEAGYEPLQPQKPERADLIAGEVLLTDPAPDEADENASAAECREAEAANLAARVREMLDVGFPVGFADGRVRPVEPRDIAILFRATTSITIYENALRRHGIRFKTVVGRGFWYRPEIMDLLNIIRVLDNSRDGTALLGALRSPMFGFDDNDLYRVAAADIDLRRGLRMLASVESGPDEAAETRHKARVAEDLLGKLRNLAGQAPLSILLQTVIDETGYSAAMGAQYGGARALANIHKFIELAGEFERDGGYSLSEFISYTTTIAEMDDREGEALVAAEDDQLVSLLTVHQAKGLQWPVVIIPDADSVPGGPRGRLATSERHGICPRNVGDGGERTRVRFADVIGIDEEARSEAESRRLLYVAATRAEDYLLISSSLQRPETTPRNSWLQWIAAAAGWDLAGRRVEPIEEPGAWQVKVDILRPSELPPPGGFGDSMAAGHRTRLLAAEPIGNVVIPDELRRRVLPVPLELASIDAIPITALAHLREDPERFVAQWLGDECLIDQGWGISRLDGAGSGIDVGTFAHIVLEMVGREGGNGLDEAVRAAERSPEIAGVLARRQVDDVKRWVAGYLASSTYRQTVAGCSRLRSEAPVGFALDNVAIEGKIDALAEMSEGGCHLLDYKTGRPAAGNGMGAYEFQIGLYCEAVRRAGGRAPDTATLVYLGPECICIPLPVDDLIAEAVSEARRLLAGLRNHQGAAHPAANTFGTTH